MHFRITTGTPYLKIIKS